MVRGETTNLHGKIDTFIEGNAARHKTSERGNGEKKIKKNKRRGMIYGPCTSAIFLRRTGIDGTRSIFKSRKKTMAIDRCEFFYFF